MNQIYQNMGDEGGNDFFINGEKNETNELTINWIPIFIFFTLSALFENS